MKYISLLVILGLHLFSFLIALRILLKQNREPISRITWIMLLFALPFFGSLLYLLFGELFLSRVTKERIARSRGILAFRSPHTEQKRAISPKNISEAHAIFELGEALNPFHRCDDTHIELLEEGYAATKTMIQDIQKASKSIHLCFYIWLPDEAGLAVLQAVRDAYHRGVHCRILVDAVGSKLLIRHPEWKSLQADGCKLQVMFPLHKNIFSIFYVRQDIRNHRKIAVIDGKIAYMGSQNCCLPSFFPKKKYAPWVDIWTKIQGSQVEQLENIFLSDWAMNSQDDIFEIAKSLHPHEILGSGTMTTLPYITGPSEVFGALSEIFQTLLYHAQKQVYITSPYFVPNESIIQALLSAARRGVEIKMMFPAKNDSPYVAAIAKSYYLQLLSAGVRIYEYQGGILHSKIFTMDENCVFYGSANLDRRSFDINYENNLCVLSTEFCQTMRERQNSYLARCQEIQLEEVQKWPLRKRLLYNCLAIFSPIF